MTSKDFFVMGQEPFPEVSLDEVKKRFDGTLSEQALADAFAICSNKFWWFEDNEYDYEEGTLEYQQARAVTDAWHQLMEQYEALIFDVLRNKNITIPKQGTIRVLIPFMKENSYYDGNGWWVKL